MKLRTYYAEQVDNREINARGVYLFASSIPSILPRLAVHVNSDGIGNPAK
jgi:hypothetical protein